ncbi:MAG: signal peptidase I [Ignavibacteria bacterium]|jgi:signal peptidase I
MNEEQSSPQEQHEFSIDIQDIALGIVLAIIMALCLRIMVAELLFVPSQSMEPALLRGDNILVSKIAYAIGPSGDAFGLRFSDNLRFWFTRPLKNDIIVFRAPKSAGKESMQHQLFVKRIIAGPRDEHPITGDVIPAKGMVISSSSILASMLKMINDPGSYTDSTYIVGEDYYYVLGDNRNHSFDSKDWGLVPASTIIGKAVMVLWSHEVDSIGSSSSLRSSRFLQFCR